MPDPVVLMASEQALLPLGDSLSQIQKYAMQHLVQV